ncbi:relaxase/mobilization nuclease domain-containing protein [Jonquetella anthropi]|uniref:relaxase/mobilization nuclease domain-containing protein n=1 Tax=Jonquetella anthropi TaxID=428712 RepID=UPI0023F2D83F|nr:relaxase/mobilization nuclease domain-containing protein [Jonquetella anthropi]
MIVKSPEKPEKGSSFKGLIEYEYDGHDEEILYVGTRNMESETMRDQIEEMNALATANTRCQDPVEHVVMSWREGEIPTQEQMNEAVDILLKEYEAEQCKVVFSAHQNTENIHLHVCLNRIDPDTYRTVTLAKGFNEKANERAARKIEMSQGWEIETSGRYIVVNGELIEKVQERDKRDKSLTQKARDYENITGAKSIQRVGKEDIAPILFNAQTWQEVHEKLAEKGFTIDKKGSGGILKCNDTIIKISQVSSKLSMSKLEKNLVLMSHQSVY